jgi:hypothetical protein
MADKNSNILKPLQEHELLPPAGAFEKAWERILLLSDDTGHRKEITKNSFEKLQDYSMQAPELDFRSLVTGEKKSTQKKQATVIYKNLLKVAAVMAIVVTGALMYFVTSKKGSTETNSGHYASAPQNGNQENNAAAGTILPDSVKESTASATIALQPPVSFGSDTKAKNIKKKGRAQLSDEGSFYNSDLFFTLVNYKEFGKEKLFTRTLKNKRVALNKYSYVNLSDKMVEMLQEVYLTKKNGKMARKAKKAKKKFAKWKKKDEKYFDKELDKNPVDIIDLGDFLMKN